MDDPSTIMPLSAECHTLKAYCKGKSDGNWQDVEYGDKKRKKYVNR